VAAGCPIRQAAREWGIPYQSLQHRLKGRQSRNAAWVDYQRLSQSQEANLAAYISTQEALGMPLTHQQVKGLAERMMGDIHGYMNIHADFLIFILYSTYLAEHIFI
jgi:hypothetical protein